MGNPEENMTYTKAAEFEFDFSIHDLVGRQVLENLRAWYRPNAGCGKHGSGVKVGFVYKITAKHIAFLCEFRIHEILGIHQ